MGIDGVDGLGGTRVSDMLLSRKLRNSCASCCEAEANVGLAPRKLDINCLGAMTPDEALAVSIAEKRFCRHFSNEGSATLVP